MQIFVATPLGLQGRGGIDRLNDAIFEEVSRRPDLNIRLQRLVTRGQGSLLKAQMIFSVALLRFIAAASRRQIDLLHIHLSVRGSAYRKLQLAALARALHIPYTIHLHGAPFDEFWSEAQGFLAREIDRAFLGSASIIVLGTYWERLVAQRLPTTKEKIVVLPNASRPASAGRIGSTGGCVQISCIGQLGPRKGTPQLIAALTNIAPRSDWQATIAGDGEIEESREKIRQAGLEGRVDVPGWLGPEKLEDLLRRTDIFVLPSFAENLPMSIIEAFSFGIPVITTPVGAISDMVQNERNGLIVPPGDVDALTRALHRLLEEPGLRERFGQVARQDHAEKYELDAYITRLAAIWKSTAARPPL